MSKSLINILRPHFMRTSLPFYRRRRDSSDEDVEETPTQIGGVGEEEQEEGEESSPMIDLTGKKLLPRRERRRLRMTNMYSPEMTGEKPVHAWADSKKLKALGLLYEQIRNAHRFTIKIEEKDRKTMEKIITENTMHMVFLLINIFFFIFSSQYKEILEEEYLVKKFNENFDKCEKEFETLPFYLKEEIETIKKSKYQNNFYNDATNPLTM